MTLRHIGLSAVVLAAWTSHANAQTFVMDNTPVTTCAGTFTDSGGAAGNYANNELFVKTFTSGMAGEVLVFDFTAFDVEFSTTCGFDVLRIYDGPTTAAPLIGAFCNSTGSPGLVAGTVPGGSVTFEFDSDTSVTDPGWQATIFCGLPDDCADASAVSSGTVNVELFGTAPDGTSNCSLGGSDRWLEFTAPAVGTLNVDTIGSGVGTELSLHSGCPGTSGNDLGCSADMTGNASVSLATTAGQVILIRVGELGNAASTATIPVNIDFAFPAPANDDCANAAPIMTGVTATGTLLGSTNDGTASCSGSGNVNPDIWYVWTSPGNGTMTAGTCGTHDANGVDSGVDTILVAFDSCGGTQLACDDDNGPPACPAGVDTGLLRDSRVEFAVTTGQTVLFRVTAFGSTPTLGDIMLTVDFVGDPSSFPESCNGDGGDGMGCTDCPCGNNATMGTIGGCMNSNSTSGQLVASGDPSVTAPDPTDLRFDANGLVPSSFAVLTSGDAIAPANAANPCFGLDSGVQSAVLDGLRCAVQNTQRHGGRPVAADGSVGATTNGWGGASGPPAGLAAQGGFVSGQTRHYQCFYRELAGTVCLTEQNTTQAITVTFTP